MKDTNHQQKVIDFTPMYKAIFTVNYNIRQRAEALRFDGFKSKIAGAAQIVRERVEHG